MKFTIASLFLTVAGQATVAIASLPLPGQPCGASIEGLLSCTDDFVDNPGDVIICANKEGQGLQWRIVYKCVFGTECHTILPTPSQEGKVWCE